MTGLCAFTAAGALVTVLSGNAFTLGWTHSVEKIRWEEDYRIENLQLVLRAARISGSGAGMEPPPDAQLKDGTWHYTPAVGPLEKLRLGRAGVTADYQLCQEGTCRALGTLIPEPHASVVELMPCR